MQQNYIHNLAKIKKSLLVTANAAKPAEKVKLEKKIGCGKGGNTKEGSKWPLDTGSFTVKQLSELSGVSVNTIQYRLNSGIRKYAEVTAKGWSERQKLKARGAMLNLKRIQNNSELIAKERRAYYKRLSEGHPKL